MTALNIIPLADTYRDWLIRLLTREWGSVRMVTRGRLVDASRLSGFIALHGGIPAGAATYRIGIGECELITLNSAVEHCGVGTALLDAVSGAARAAGCRRLWLITTNDNIDALAFYQKRGFVLRAAYPDSIAEARHLKPEIPLYGCHGIPIRDELELERQL